MYRPRLTTEQLTRMHGTAEAAFAAADFLSAIRLSDGDPLMSGMALVMLGHERRGLALLETVPDLPPRARLIQALGHWLTGVDDGEARLLAAAAADVGGPATALTHAIGIQRPHIVWYCTAANTLHAADTLKASGAARITVLRNVPAKADIAFAPDTPARQLAGALDGPVDCVLVDNLLMLPPQLAAIDAPKIAQVADIEFAYAQRGQELGWLDLIVSIGNSAEHVSARARFGDHVVMRVQALDEFRGLEITPAELRERAGSMDRPIDALVTGGVDKPFYPDKQHRFAALAQSDADMDVRIIAQYLPYERYQALTAQAKFTFMSSRMAQMALTRRGAETLAAGTMLICEQDHAGHVLFGEGVGGIHGYRDGFVARDVARIVAEFPRHHAEFLRGLPILADSLASVYPRPEVAVRRSVRYLSFWAQMARAQLGWSDIVAGHPKAIGRSMALPTATDCYAAKQESWLGLPPSLRGRLLAPLASMDDDALAMPRLGQVVTAQGFLAINAADEDLYRHQAEGQFRARATILHTLNRARRRHPRSLSTWYLIGRHLAEVGRFAAAARVLASLLENADALELEARVTMVDGSYEVNDFPFVDAVAADDLARAWPVAMGPCRDLARRWVLGRAHGLLAAIHGLGNDTQAFLEHARTALDLARGDAAVLDHLLSGAVRLWHGGDQVTRILAATICLAAMRLSLRAFFDRFPDALQMLDLLGRDQLCDLLTRRWMRARARICLDAEAPAVTEAERAVFAGNPVLFQRNAATFSGTRLAPILDGIAADLGLALESRDAA